MTKTTAFALRTEDAAWIKRNNGVTGEAGRIFIQVPVADIEVVTFCKNDHLRYRLPDVPRDWGNRWAMCPAVWVPETAKLAGASTQLSADTLARMAETAAWKARADA